MTEGSGPWTILAILNWSTDFLRRKGVDSPRTDVEVLMAAALGLKRIDLYIRFDQLPPQDAVDRFRAMLLRRGKREPVSHILGRREFYGLEFAVDRRVLTPRPETEHLVDLAKSALADVESPKVADIGTGSGIIAVCVALSCPKATVVASDISADALAVARANVTARKVADRVRLVKADMFESPDLAGPFDAILSNPPYIPEGDRQKLEPEVANYEPACALFSGADGLDAVRRLVSGARSRLVPGGLLAFEIGYGQSEAVHDLVTREGYSDCLVRMDHAGIPRVFSARRAYG